MKGNIWAIIGILLIVVFAVIGHSLKFDQAWIVSIAGAAVGLGVVLRNQGAKRKKGERWKAYAIGGGVALGTILAVVGGVNESIITTIIGSVLVIAGAAVGIVSGVKNG